MKTRTAMPRRLLAALALCVLLAVPVYGITQRGVGTYLRGYLQPSPFMLPFNLLSELSRTLALAVRLFGNVMSFSKIVAILLAIAPLVFPALLNVPPICSGLSAAATSCLCCFLAPFI